MIQTEKLLSIIAAGGFCAALALYALYCLDPFDGPVSQLCSPGAIICVALAAGLFATISFTLEILCAVKKQPCLKKNAAKLRLIWNAACLLLTVCVLFSGGD